MSGQGPTHQHSSADSIFPSISLFLSVCVCFLLCKTVSFAPFSPLFHLPVTPFSSRLLQINGTWYAQIWNPDRSMNSIRPLRKGWQVLTNRPRTGKHKVSSVKLIERRVIAFTTSRSITLPAGTDHQWDRQQFPGQDKSQGWLDQHTCLTDITAVTKRKLVRVAATTFWKITTASSSVAVRVA